jgi:hypothetical protein
MSELSSQAVGVNYTDFKQMLQADVWPEVSRPTLKCYWKPSSCRFFMMTHKYFAAS